MLGSRASFKLQGLAVDFDNRLWSKDARPGTGFSPTLTCGFWWQARHHHPHRHHRCYHHDHQHPPSGQWLVVAGRAGPAAFFSLCFPAACGRCSIRARSPLRRHWAQVVQMEGDSRRLPRCAGGQLNLWPELDQLEQWIELSVSVSALTACALPPPRERTFWRMSTSKGVDWGAELLVFQGEGCS